MALGRQTYNKLMSQYASNRNLKGQLYNTLPGLARAERDIRAFDERKAKRMGEYGKMIDIATFILSGGQKKPKSTNTLVVDELTRGLSFQESRPIVNEWLGGHEPVELDDSPLSLGDDNFIRFGLGDLTPPRRFDEPPRVYEPFELETDAFTLDDEVF